MTIESKFAAALDDLITVIRQDRSIIAAILCGSLSHDTVWAKSDIDLALITIDDKKIESSHAALNAGGVNVHALLMPRGEFRKTVEGSIRNSFMHSFLAKGRLLFTHDETISQLLSRLNEIGERDTQLQLLSAGNTAICLIDKAHKWFVTRDDLDYTALWILYSATALARIEVMLRRQLVDREVITQALKLNPEFFETIYSRLLNAKKNRKSIEQALKAVDEYLEAHTAQLFAPLLEYLQDSGEARSASEIEAHFKRNHGIEGVTTVCEYLSDQGLISKVSLPHQLTKRSNVQVEEMAFVYTTAPTRGGLPTF